MRENKLFTVPGFHFDWELIKDHPLPANVLMASPEHFDVIDVKNAHMEGHAGAVDRALAMDQWEALAGIYRQLADRDILAELAVIPGADGCEDMVFAANQSFPWIDGEGNKMVVMSRMKHASRQREVIHFEKFYREKGYRIVQAPGDRLLEGMGDLIPVPGKRLIMAGYGHRTDHETLETLTGLLETPIIGLELADERFYHLDTCFIPLDNETVLYCPEAFTLHGLKMIDRLFSKPVRIPADEAVRFFSLNAHAVSGSGGKAAIIEKGSTCTYHALRNAGYTVIETETSEFMKSGGSVFCMKMMYY